MRRKKPRLNYYSRGGLNFLGKANISDASGVRDCIMWRIKHSAYRDSRRDRDVLIVLDVVAKRRAKKLARLLQHIIKWLQPTIKRWRNYPVICFMASALVFVALALVGILIPLLLSLIANETVKNLLGVFEPLALVIALLVFLGSEKEAHTASVYQAWQVITSAKGQRGSGGRKEALEWLNSDQPRFGGYLPTWMVGVHPKQPLNGLEAKGAFLVGIQLPRADLSRANLRKAILQEANLQGADLEGTNLEGANLEGAKLEGAKFFHANLQGANLQYANLEGAKLREAQFQGADLWGANLQGTALDNANLQGANLHEANLKGADLQCAKLEGAKLLLAYLYGANLRVADLQGANLQYANLEGAKLLEANLEGANLRFAYLEGADLRGADLSKARYLEDAFLNGAKYNTEEIVFPGMRSPSTQFPDGFNPEAHGMILNNDPT